MNVNLFNPLTRSTWLWGPNHSRVKLLFPGGGCWFKFAFGVFPNFSETMCIANWVINCVMLAKASELRERGTDKRKGQSREKLQRHGKKIKWKDTVVSSGPRWGAKIKSSLSAQEVHIWCLTNMDTREEGRNYKKLNSKNQCQLRLAEHCAMFR